MPSPAEGRRLRLTAERTARLIALAALALLLMVELRGTEQLDQVRTGVEDLRLALRAATLDESRHRAGVVLRADGVPAPGERDWLAALSAAGVPVSWTMEAIDPIVIAADPIADPRGGVDVRIWRGGAHAAVVADGAGELARLEPSAGAAGVLARAVVRDVEVRVQGQRAWTAKPDSLHLREILVLGRAGWEARFALRTLEELGWSVHARLAVAPGVVVTQGQPAAPDTGRYAAVVVLDTTATRDAAALQRYVRAGGGVLLVGEGTRIDALAAFAPGSSGGREGGADELLPVEMPILGLARHPVHQLRSDALVLQRHGDTPVIAARRVGAGRLVQAGYVDSWRLHMEGGEHGPETHRDLWARMLAAVAHAPMVQRPSGEATAEPAPLASLMDALGPPSGEAVPASRRGWLESSQLFLASVMLLMLEWASRRLRGER